MDYPVGRPAFWANKLVRTLHKSCAANEIGIEAVHLVTVIAMQEDSTRYSKAITFWNGQLLPITGFQSWGRLDRARQRAADAGWLHFESGGRHKAGKYWSLIPPGLLDTFPDASVGDTIALQNQAQDGDQAVIETGSGGDRNVIETGSDGEPSYLCPIPIPVPKEGGGIPPCPALEILAAFNSAFGLRNRLTAKRRAQLLVRWRDPNWRENWRLSLERGSPSRFLLGDNDRGWKINLDFFLKPDSVTNILEGKYDNRTSGHTNGRRLTAAENRERANAEAFAAVWGDPDGAANALLGEESGTVHGAPSGHVGFDADGVS